MESRRYFELNENENTSNTVDAFKAGLSASLLEEPTW